MENYEVQFFRALDPILMALIEDMLILFLLGTGNINKAVSPDKNCTFAVNFTTQISF